ncbi:3-oxo-tetronate kinase [Nocardiopsis sediminis]|uniref:3-oxo-tetronate kinase n=1 Tax=Nocardiopsis sediminis TaxID=1778267 RepID=A0ABV8FJH7_9ACTN
MKQEPARARITRADGIPALQGREDVRPLIGCIADDHTGATDVASAIRGRGLSTALVFGPPSGDRPLPEAEAVVIALKSRTLPTQEAVALSLAAQRALTAAGVPRTYVKYCSTFDSTAEGNIGPVTEALLAATGAGAALACPAAPANGRTVYRGHLFVGDVPLAESPMRHHPLTPMTDSDVTRLLARQTAEPVALLSRPHVATGADAARARLAELRAEGARHVVADAVDEGDLDVLGEVARDHRLVTGAAGLAAGLAAALRTGRPPGAYSTADPEPEPDPDGPAAVLAGSCSTMTLRQIEHARAVMPSRRLDPLELTDPGELDRVRAWVDAHAGAGPVLVYASQSPEERRAAQGRLGTAETARLVEHALAETARHLVDNGVRRLVVAGGETSGAIVGALGIDAVRVGREVDAGVPWTTAAGGLALLLKSGNFGAPDLFTRALSGRP